MNFKVVTPVKLILEGEADSIIVPGMFGEFGVLPQHTPLLSTIKKGRLKIKQGNTTSARDNTSGGGSVEREFEIHDGFVEVLPDKVTILTENAVEIKDNV